MKYRIMGKTGVSVSVLGYGCMRYPTLKGRIDEERTRAQLVSAIEGGVNYFDTAYMYLGGQSEMILGKTLKELGCRDKVYIADKIPPYIVYSRKDMDKILTTMLERLQTGRIDFLLAHALNDYDSWIRLKGLGYPEFLDDARKAGKIRFAGFSWHGNQEEFKKVVDDYPWDFCQIQYNYLDENYQAGRGGLDHAAEKGLGIAIMEPLRGGSLVGKMPVEVAAIMEQSAVKRSPAAWALDWVWDHPGVSTVLSGLNEESHIAENIALADKAEPLRLTAADKAVLSRVGDAYHSLMKVGCTGCSYCMPCPFGVNIPYIFSMYNSLHLFRSQHVRYQYVLFTSGIGGGKPSGAEMCRNCGKCETRCPQHIRIREKLKEAHRALNLPAFRPVAGILKLVMRLRSRKKS